MSMSVYKDVIWLQDRQCTYNVMRRVRVTIFAVVKPQVSWILRVCLC